FGPQGAGFPQAEWGFTLTRAVDRATKLLQWQQRGLALTETKFRVVIAGGGVAALETALALHALAEERVEVRLIAPDPYFWYRPVSVMTPFGGKPVQPLALADLTRHCGATFERDALATVDPGSHAAHTSRGAAHRYD